MKISVAIDGSDNSIRAAEYAIFLTRHVPEAHLEVIHVIDHKTAKDQHLLVQNEAALTFKREQIIRPIRKLAVAAKLKVEVTLLKGDPSREIIKHVKTELVDHLVVGSRGLNIFQEMMLGSVSHKVMKHADCPVTVVK